MNYRKTTKAELIRAHKKMSPVYWAAMDSLTYIEESRAVLLMLRNNCDQYSREREIIGAAISLLVEAEIGIREAA